MALQLTVFGLALAACAAGACLLPTPVRAQQSLHQAFADGFSLLRFEPSPAGDRFTLVPEGAVPAAEPGLRAPAKLDSSNVKERAEITFSGYQTLPGGRGVVFVEMTDPVAVEVSRAGQVLEYKLLGASVPLKNNKHPLLLRDFSSSVLTAVLVPDKKAVRLVITLRSAVSPTHRMVPRGRGVALEVELPAPTAR